jgi:hypothetical protein
MVNTPYNSVNLNDNKMHEKPFTYNLLSQKG